MRTMLGVMLAVVIALSLTTTACQRGPDSTQIPRVGKPAPGFELPNLDGQTVSLGDLRDKPVMVNFWATWCAPCVHEMPYIQEVYDVWSGKGLSVLAINIGESPPRVQEFMEDEGLSFPVLLDEDGKVSERYNVRVIPTSFFIDSEGIIHTMKTGAFPSRAAIEEDLKKIIP